MNIAKCCASCIYFQSENAGLRATLFGKCELNDKKTNSSLICEKFGENYDFIEDINEEIKNDTVRELIDIKSDDVEFENIKNYILNGLEKASSSPQYFMENYLVNKIKEEVKNHFTAYELEKKGYGSALDDLIKINSILTSRYEMIPYLGYSSSSDYSTIKEIKENIKFLSNYQGSWNLDYFYEYHKISYKELVEHYNEIESKIFPTPEQEFSQSRETEKRKEKEKEEFIKRYYEKKVTFTEKDFKKYLKKESFFSKKQVDERGLSYPIILRLYKNEQLIFISKVKQNLMTRIDNYRKNKDFDDYSVSYVPESIIDDLHAKANIEYLLASTTMGITNMNSCGLYRTLNQVKTRYKGDFDLRIIRKIIEKYNVPYYRLPSGSEICHRDKFDEALKKYYDNYQK